MTQQSADNSIWRVVSAHPRQVLLFRRSVNCLNAPLAAPYFPLHRMVVVGFQEGYRVLLGKS